MTLDWILYIIIVSLCILLFVLQKVLNKTEKNLMPAFILLFLQYMSISGSQSVDSYQDISNYPIETIIGMYIFSLIAIALLIYALLKKEIKKETGN